MRAMSRDRNEDEDEDGVALSAANGTSFTKKLFEILQNPKNNDIIRWGHDGLSFEVISPKRLETEILPKYFRHARFQSLVRQLNFYAFKKVSKERSSWVYSHELFQRLKPELLEGLRRKTNTTPSLSTDGDKKNANHDHVDDDHISKRARGESYMSESDLTHDDDTRRASASNGDWSHDLSSSEMSAAMYPNVGVLQQYYNESSSLIEATNKQRLSAEVRKEKKSDEHLDQNVHSMKTSSADMQQALENGFKFPIGATNGTYAFPVPITSPAVGYGFPSSSPTNIPSSSWQLSGSAYEGHSAMIYPTLSNIPIGATPFLVRENYPTSAFLANQKQEEHQIRQFLTRLKLGLTPSTELLVLFCMQRNPWHMSHLLYRDICQLLMGAPDLVAEVDGYVHTTLSMMLKATHNHGKKGAKSIQRERSCSRGGGESGADEGDGDDSHIHNTLNHHNLESSRRGQINISARNGFRHEVVQVSIKGAGHSNSNSTISESESGGVTSRDVTSRESGSSGSRGSGSGSGSGSDQGSGSGSDKDGRQGDDGEQESGSGSGSDKDGRQGDDGEQESGSKQSCTDPSDTTESHEYNSNDSRESVDGADSEDGTPSEPSGGGSDEGAHPNVMEYEGNGEYNGLYLLLSCVDGVKNPKHSHTSSQKQQLDKDKKRELTSLDSKTMLGQVGQGEQALVSKGEKTKRTKDFVTTSSSSKDKDKGKSKVANDSDLSNPPPKRAKGHLSLDPSSAPSALGLTETRCMHMGEVDLSRTFLSFAVSKLQFVCDLLSIHPIITMSSQTTASWFVARNDGGDERDQKVGPGRGHEVEMDKNSDEMKGDGLHEGVSVDSGPQSQAKGSHSSSVSNGEVKGEDSKAKPKQQAASSGKGRDAAWVDSEDSDCQVFYVAIRNCSESWWAYTSTYA